MTDQISFKTRVRNNAVTYASQYDTLFVKKSYLLISDAFIKRPFYILEAEPTNYLHLIGVSTNLSASVFYTRCLTGTLTESDFDLSFHGKDPKQSKGAIRQKILTLPEMFNILQQESFVEEDFSKNVVRCSFASSNGICTVGFVSTPIARPMTLLRGDELDHSKAKHLKLLLSKERDEERFSQILIGKKKDIKYLASEIEELINTNLFDA